MRWMLGGCLVALFVLVVAAVWPDRYEFKALTAADGEVVLELRAAGLDGWRVVHVRRTLDGYEVLLERRADPWGGQDDAPDERRRHLMDR